MRDWEHEIEKAVVFAMGAAHAGGLKLRTAREVLNDSTVDQAVIMIRRATEELMSPDDNDSDSSTAAP